MTIDTSGIKLTDLIGQAISLLAFGLSLISVLYVYVQVKAQRRQQQMDFHVRLVEINRELLNMGFAYPELLAVLRGEEIDDKDKQTRFIQMWINQSLVMWLGKEHGIIGEDVWYSLRRDIATFVNRPPMKAHWLQFAPYYIPGFANFMNGLVQQQNQAEGQPAYVKTTTDVGPTIPFSSATATENTATQGSEKMPQSRVSGAANVTLY